MPLTPELHEKLLFDGRVLGLKVIDGKLYQIWTKKEQMFDIAKEYNPAIVSSIDDEEYNIKQSL